MGAVVPYNQRKSNWEKAKRDASLFVVSEHIIIACREYAKSNSITRAARAGGFSNEEMLMLLAEPKVIEVLEEEIKARSASAKITKDILVNRLNTVSESLCDGIDTQIKEFNSGKTSRPPTSAIDMLNKMTDTIAKIKGFYKDDQSKEDSLQISELLEERKKIFWGAAHTHDSGAAHSHDSGDMHTNNSGAAHTMDDEPHDSGEQYHPASWDYDPHDE